MAIDLIKNDEMLGDEDMLEDDDCDCERTEVTQRVMTRNGLHSLAMALLGAAILTGCLAFAYLVLHSDIKSSDRRGYLVADGVFLYFAFDALVDRIR